jgi:hypothetical protein
MISGLLLILNGAATVGREPARPGQKPAPRVQRPRPVLYLWLVLVGFGSITFTANAQQIDCAGFAGFVHSTLGDHLEDGEFFQRYFNRNLETQSQEQLESLVKWSRDCEDYIHHNVTSSGEKGQIPDQNYWFDLSLWIAQGIGRLEQMVEAKKQEAVDQEFKKNLVIANKRNEALIADIPSCDDDSTVSALKELVKNRERGHEIIGLKDFSDVSNPLQMGLRICQADALFDVGERQIEFGVKWFDKSSGQLSITIF